MTKMIVERNRDGFKLRYKRWRPSESTALDGFAKAFPQNGKVIIRNGVDKWFNNKN